MQEQSLRDNKSLVIVEKQGTYQVSNDDVTKNVYQFSGMENTLKITRVYSTKWLCSYKIINYPFDTQVFQIFSLFSNFKSPLLDMPNDFYPCWYIQDFP